MAVTPLAKAGGGDDHGGMDGRLIRLEEDMREVRGDVRALRTDVSDIKQQIAIMDGRISAMEGRMEGRFAAIEARLSQMPTTWQSFSILLTMLAGVFAIVRFGVH